MRYLLTIIAVVMFAGCGLIPEKVSLKDVRLKPMFEAMGRVDRKSLGFTPVDPDALIRLEYMPRSGYDAMLHIDGRSSRTVAFRRIPLGMNGSANRRSLEGRRDTSLSTVSLTSRLPSTTKRCRSQVFR